MRAGEYLNSPSTHNEVQGIREVGEDGTPDVAVYDSMAFGRFSDRDERAVDHRAKPNAQSFCALLIPDCRSENVLARGGTNDNHAGAAHPRLRFRSSAVRRSCSSSSARTCSQWIPVSGCRSRSSRRRSSSARCSSSKGSSASTSSGVKLSQRSWASSMRSAAVSRLKSKNGFARMPKADEETAMAQLGRGPAEGEILTHWRSGLSPLQLARDAQLPGVQCSVSLGSHANAAFCCKGCNNLAVNGGAQRRSYTAHLHAFVCSNAR